MGNFDPDDTQQGLRALDARICPRCRHKSPTPADPTEILRCPKDGLALLLPSEIVEADGDPFLGTTIAGRFVVIGRLGAGSMGTVYRARQEAVGRDVAIKILRSDRAFDTHAKARFQREARAMSLLTSPHTVTVFDFGEIPDDRDDLGGGTSLYLAMEMLEGESLGERLKRLRRLPVEDAVRIARHALLSLSEAHDKGVIHRDLKPDNLFLCKAVGDDEVCKVLDFGIAKVVNDSIARVDALETQAGTVFGTPRYMSPEQAQGKPLDPRSDLYSLGVLLYQMVAGRAPFVDDDAVVVMARHIKTVPALVTEAAPEAGIPDALAELVARALAKDPDERPASAKEFILDLDRALGAPRKLPSSRPETSGSSAVASGEMSALVRDDLEGPAKTISGSPPPKRSRALRVAILVGLIVTLVGLLVFGPLRQQAPTAASDAASEGPKQTPLPVATVTFVPAPAPSPSATPDLEASTSAVASAAAASAAVASSAPSATARASAAATPPAPIRKPKKYTLFE